MKRLVVWLKALFCFALLPYIMIRLSQHWDPFLPQIPDWWALAPGVIVTFSGAYVALRGYLILAALRMALRTDALSDRQIYLPLCAPPDLLGLRSFFDWCRTLEKFYGAGTGNAGCGIDTPGLGIAG